MAPRGDSSRGSRPPPGEDKEEEAQVDAGPNFGLSGKLAAETNTVKGVVSLNLPFRQTYFIGSDPNSHQGIEIQRAA